MPAHQRFVLYILPLVILLILTGCGPSPRTDDIAPLSDEAVVAVTTTPAPTAEASAPEPAESPSLEPEPATVEPAPEPGLDTGPVITFTLSGGIVGFCDTLTIDAGGGYALQTCIGEEPLTGTLRENDLASLEAWHNNLSDFSLSIEQAVDQPDSLNSELTFNGRGDIKADETQQQIILDWVNGVLIRLRPQPVAGPPTTLPAGIAGIDEDGLCPNIARPAVIVANFADQNLLTLLDPAGQERCDVPLEQPPFGRIVPNNGNLYYPVFDKAAQTLAVGRLGPDGVFEPLDFTAVSMTEFKPYHFALSQDGSKIAWATTAILFENDPPVSRTDLWLANTDGSEQVQVLSAFESPGTVFIEPVRFSLDQTSFFLAVQPGAIDGAVFGFSGRYNSLYRIDGFQAELQLIYACDLPENALCIGDVSADGSTFVYVEGEGKTVNLIGTEGNPLGQFSPPATDFVGQAVFGPTGTLAFISATLVESPDSDIPLPRPGYISLIESPYTGDPQTVLTDDRVATLWGWIDADRLAMGSIDEFGNIGTAVVTVDGQVTELSSNFALAILR
ncbi:MAG: hypothetical protein R3264_12095 [Anaerolineae bacterium]|nr:hypothetical protein [Anaerolineae bacterium]